MASANEKLQDATISHQIDELTYSNSVVRKMISLLNKADIDIVAQLSIQLDKMTPSTFNLERLDQLLKSVQRLNKESYAVVSKELNNELKEFVAYETDYEQKLLTSVSPINVATVSASQVYAGAMARPFQGKLLKEWMQSLEASKAVLIRDAVRLGYIESETTSQIIKRVRGTKALNYKDGILEISRRNAESVILTAIAHTSSFAQERVFEANADIVAGMEYTSVLDTRTTALCFVESTDVISVSSIDNVFRAKYSGDIITITTASGKKLEGTPNHPILTSHGFLPMGEINPSEHIVYTVTDKFCGVGSNNDIGVKSNIRALFDAFNKPSVATIKRKSATANDFYGDGVGMNDHIDIVSPNSELRSNRVSSLNKGVINKLFTIVKNGVSLFCNSVFFNLLVSRLPVIQATKRKIISFKNLIEPAFASAIKSREYLRWSHAVVKKLNHESLIPIDVDVTLTALKNWHGVGFFEKVRNSCCGRFVFFGNSSSTDSAIVFKDNVVSVKREFRDCHVYSLGNSLGFYIANGIIVKNCASRDGNFYQLDKPRPAIPAHIRCRSRYTVRLKSFREMGLDADNFSASTRASLDGQVPASTTYQKWLERQSVARQNEVLGVTKATLFRKGELPLNRFVSRQGHVYTLDELKLRDAEAFKRAGL